MHLEPLMLADFPKLTLGGSGLPHATAAGGGLGTAMWLVSLYERVPKCDCFSSLPCATFGKEDRYSYVVYLGSGCQDGGFEGNYA